MHVSHNAPDKLIVDHATFGIAAASLILALAFILVGLSNFSAEPVQGIAAIVLGLGAFFGLMAAFGERSQLVLDRDKGEARLSKLTWRGLQRWSFDLRHVARAQVRMIKARKGGDLDMTVLVVRGGMDAGAHDLTARPRQSLAPHAVAGQINAWLGVEEASS